MLFLVYLLAPVLEVAALKHREGDGDASDSGVDLSKSNKNTSDAEQAIQYLHRALSLPSRGAVLPALEAQIMERGVPPAQALHAIAPDLTALNALDKLPLADEEPIGM